MKHPTRKIAGVLGAAIANSFAGAAANTIDESPFLMSAFAKTHFAAQTSAAGGDKGLENHCGGDKEGEGSCGEGKCGTDKGGEGSCGEGKCGGDEAFEGACGGDLAEGLCGVDPEEPICCENTCGADIDDEN